MKDGAPERILVIQLRRIGDILLTTPVIGALKEAFPGAAVDFMAEPMGEPVLRGHPGLREMIVFKKEDFFGHLAEVRRRRYDWVLDFLNTPRSAQITWASGAPVRAGFDAPFWGLAYNRRVPRSSRSDYIVRQKLALLRVLGLRPSDQALPKVHLTDADFAGVRSWWGENKLDRFPEIVGLAPAHRHPVRQWPEAKWAALLPRVLKEGRAALLFGGPGEEALLERLAKPFPGRAFPIPAGSLRQAASLMARCRVVVSNCSGSMHLAVAAGTPTVTIYGPSSPEDWNPRRSPHRYIQAQGLACLGCRLDACPYGHECMAWVSPERVAGEVEAALSDRGEKAA